jgi:hypothetical protein
MERQFADLLKGISFTEEVLARVTPRRQPRVGDDGLLCADRPLTL